MARTQKAKGDGPGERQSLYFPKDMLDEIKDEALSQDRSLSWIIQQAWRIARLRVNQRTRTTLLDAWIDEKAWRIDDPQLDQILGAVAETGRGKRKG
jgi:uncharacterized small protein (TIGR04563 family)